MAFGCRVGHMKRRLRNKEGWCMWARPQRTFHFQLKVFNYTLDNREPEKIFEQDRHLIRVMFQED